MALSQLNTEILYYKKSLPNVAWHDMYMIVFQLCQSWIDKVMYYIIPIDFAAATKLD